MNSQKVVIAEDLGQSLKEAIEACERDKVFMLTDETTEFTHTLYPEYNGTYYRFNRANGTNYVWVRADAKIDGTTENRILGQNKTLSSGWNLKLAPAD